MIPQMLVFAFLLLSSVVAIWRDLTNSQLTLATAWNVTNTVILGAFMVVACREAWRIRHPAAVPSAPVPGVAEDRRTVVIVPPALEPRLGVPPAAEPTAVKPAAVRPTAPARSGRRAVAPDHDQRPTRKESVLS